MGPKRRGNTRMPTYSDLFNTVTSTPTGGAPPGSGDFVFVGRKTRQNKTSMLSGSGRETTDGSLLDGCVDGGTNDADEPRRTL